MVFNAPRRPCDVIWGLYFHQHFVNVRNSIATVSLILTVLGTEPKVKKGLCHTEQYTMHVINRYSIDDVKIWKVAKHCFSFHTLDLQ